MSKQIAVVRTFPNAWYKFIVEGDSTGLADSERLIVESAMTKAFPDGGSIVAARRGTETTKFSTLVCESYSINGCPDKTEGKTFKVKVMLDDTKNPKSFAQYVTEANDNKEKDPLQYKEYVVDRLTDALEMGDDSVEMSMDDATKVLTDCGYIDLEPTKFWSKIDADINTFNNVSSEKVRDKKREILEAAYTFRNTKENHVGSTEDPEVIRDRINRRLEDFLTKTGDLKDGELTNTALADLPDSDKAIAAHKNLGYLADMPIDKFWYGVLDLIRKYDDKGLPDGAKGRIRTQLICAYLIRDEKWNKPFTPSGTTSKKDKKSNNEELHDLPSDITFSHLIEMCGDKWTKEFKSKIVKEEGDAWSFIGREYTDVPDQDEEGNVKRDEEGKIVTTQKLINKYVRVMADSAERAEQEGADVNIKYGPISDRELNKVKTETVNGVELIPVAKAAQLLRHKIEEAYGDGDTEKLETYKKLLPVIAYDVTRDSPQFRWKLNQLETRLDKIDAIHTAFGNAVATLPVIYNEAFDITSPNPYGSLNGKQTVADTDVDELTGSKSGSAWLHTDKAKDLKKNNKLGYAKGVFESVIYGETYDDFLISTVSVLASRQTMSGRGLARQSNQDLAFRAWFRKNIKIPENESSVHYAKVQYILENTIDLVQSVANDIEKGLNFATLKNKESGIAFRDIAPIITSPYMYGRSGNAQKNRLRCMHIAARVFETVVPGAKFVGEGGTSGASGKFTGQFQEFRTAFVNECENVADEAYGLQTKLQDEFDQYEKKSKEKISLFKSSGKVKGSRKAFSPFTSGEMFADGSDGYKFIKKYAGDNAIEFASERYETYVYNVSSNNEVALRGKRTSAAEQEWMAGNDAGSADRRGSSEDLDSALNDISAVSAASDDEEVTRGKKPLTTSTAGEKKEDPSVMVSVRDKFLDADIGMLSDKAALVGIDDGRVADIRNWLKTVISLPGGVGEMVGIYSKRDNEEYKRALVAMNDEIKDKEKASKEAKKAFEKAEKAFKKAQKDYERNAKKDPDADTSGMEDAEDVMNDARAAMEEADRALAAAKDTKAARSVNTPDMARAFSMSKFTAKEWNDVSPKKKQRFAEEVKEREADVNKAEAELAKAENDLADLKSKLDDSAENVKELEKAEKRVEEAKKARMVSKGSLESLERSLKLTITPTDVNTGMSTEDKLSLVREALAQGGVKIDTYSENDPNRYSSSGIPDMLILWYIDDIVVSDKMTTDEKIASIRKTCLPHLGAFEQFMTRQCKLEDLFSTHEMGMDESAGQDKFLASIEAMIELIEGSDIDPEKKLEMLDAVEFAFTAWCEKEEIVPEDINPQDDADAITNHPEDNPESDAQ